MTPPIQLVNLGILPRLGLRGSDAAIWLEEQAVDCPKDILSSTRTADGERVMRTDDDEFIVETDDGNRIAQLASQLPPQSPDLLQVPREEVTLCLSGPQAGAVLLQTCGIDFRTIRPQQIVFSRIAGVTCGILLEEDQGGTAYRMWADPSYEDYLWRTLAEIVTGLGGSTTARS